MDRHITDSLALLPSIEGAYSSHCTVSEGESLKVIDIGSGAGLPGLVLAIARPGAKFSNPNHCSSCLTIMRQRILLPVH